MKSGGTVRLRPEIWEKLTALSVKVTIKLARPVNQSAVLHYLCDNYLDDVIATDVAKHHIDNK